MITIAPLTPDDLPALARIQESAFADDRHTRMKMAEKGVTDLGSELQPISDIARMLAAPGWHAFKAVDGGEMVGFSLWKEHGFGEDVSGSDLVPLTAPVPPPAVPAPATSLQRLAATTSGHLATMQARANRPGSRSLFCAGIAVDPAYHGKGAATALIAHAAEIADENNARAWVHLSDHAGGVRAFEKNGFRVVNDVSVDLDAYAEKKREGGWGVYTFRFLVREPGA